MNYIASVILVSAHLYAKWLRAGAEAAACVNRETITHLQAGVRRYGVRLDLAAWLGHRPSGAERVAVSRALKQLETGGYLQRERSGRSRRTQRVRLTDLGQAAAEQILATPPDEVVLLPIPWEDCGVQGTVEEVSE